MSIDQPSRPVDPLPPPPADEASPGWGDHMDPILAANVEAMRDESAILRGQGNEEGARASDAEADKFETMISDGFLAQSWNPAEDRIRALERSTLTRDVRDGPDYADHLLEAGGFTPIATPESQVHDYTRPRNPSPFKDRAKDSEPKSPIEVTVDKAVKEVMGLPEKPRELKEIVLKHDLWVCQYYDAALPLDQDTGGRRHEWWAPIDPADIPNLAERKQFMKAEDGSALPPRTWKGDRSHVQVALIPAGTTIQVGVTDPQIETDFEPRMREILTRDDPLPPEFEPSQILEGALDRTSRAPLNQGRIGGAVEIRFDHFDDAWVKGVTQIRPEQSPTR